MRIYIYLFIFRWSRAENAKSPIKDKKKGSDCHNSNSTTPQHGIIISAREFRAPLPGQLFPLCTTFDKRSPQCRASTFFSLFPRSAVFDTERLKCIKALEGDYIYVETPFKGLGHRGTVTK